METRSFDDAPAVFRAAADVLAEAVKARPASALGLPAGAASIPLYDELASRRDRGELALGRAWGFALEELVLPEDDPRNVRSFAARHWPRAGITLGRSEVPEGWHVDEVECNRYEAIIVGAGGLDLAIVVLGADGSVASLQPDAVKDAPHLVTLPAAAADALGMTAGERPLRGLSVGLAILQAARRLVVLGLGSAQAAAARALTQGPEDQRWPCSLLRGHRDVHVLLDAEAARPPR